MSNEFWNAFFGNLPGAITAIVGLVTAIGGVFIGVLTLRINAGMKDVQRCTNGMTDKLVKEAEQRGHRKGRESVIRTLAETRGTEPAAVPSQPAPLGED